MEQRLQQILGFLLRPKELARIRELGLSAAQAAPRAPNTEMPAGDNEQQADSAASPA
jgi:hypothetical protein